MKYQITVTCRSEIKVGCSCFETPPLIAVQRLLCPVFDLARHVLATKPSTQGRHSSLHVHVHVQGSVFSFARCSGIERGGLRDLDGDPAGGYTGVAVEAALLCCSRAFSFFCQSFPFSSCMSQGVFQSPGRKKRSTTPGKLSVATSFG